jgi:hypothetical protein
MSEAMEMCEWFESLIEDLIKEYQNKYEYYDNESYWNLGAVEALEELLRRLNED